MNTYKMLFVVVFIIIFINQIALGVITEKAVIDIVGDSWGRAIAETNHGWLFTVNEKVTLTHLGLFDWHDDGFLQSMPVNLWNWSDGSLLTSGTISAGKIDPLDNHFRYIDVVDVVLNVGQEYVVSFYSEKKINDLMINRYRRLELNSKINYIGGAWGSGTNQNGMPLNILSSESRYPERFGPIFLFTIPEQNPPIADAGSDILAFAGLDGTAVVKLNGSGSYDADDDELEYFWYEGSDQIATGVDPNVVLAVGDHIIDLIVDDGKSSSEPDSVVVTVLEMPNTVPVADAGDDITVFAGPDGMATVGLDGSGSYDADEDELEYFWFNDANELVAEGVDPNVVFVAGEHVIDLVVDDGTDSSEPNSVVVTVIEAVEAQARVYPRVLNITSRGRFVIARMQLPDGISVDDIESDSLTLTIGDVTIESVRQRAVTSVDRHYVFGFFDRGRVIAQGEGKPKLDIIIVGKLTTGQCIYGEDTIKIVKSNGPKKPLPSRKPVRNGRGRRVSR